MRADPKAAILTVRSAYAQTPEASYLQRWRLVSLAAELATPDARPLLAEIAEFSSLATQHPIEMRRIAANRANNILRRGYRYDTGVVIPVP